MRSLLEQKVSYDEAQAAIQQNESTAEQLSQFKELQTFNLDKRLFHRGQWIDAKDTIDQWLEAQVVDIRDVPSSDINPTQAQPQQQAFIHYNGWGSRWDEWIPSSSPRLAPFRTFTVQNPRSVYLSPFPNITPDATNATLMQEPAPYLADQSGDSMTKMIEDIVSMVSETKDMLDAFNTERRDVQKAMQIAQQQRFQSDEEEKKEQVLLMQDQSSLMEFEEIKENPINPRRASPPSNLSSVDSNSKIIFQAAQLAPIIDRMGRMMIDFAPHLNNIVKLHHLRLRDQRQNFPSQQVIGEAQINLGRPRIDLSSELINTENEGEPQGNNHYRQLMTSVSPIENILTTIRNLNQVSRDIVFGGQRGENNQPLASVERAIRIQQQVPIMYSPGEISQISNIFDNRMFEEGGDSNIEFHIHAFLSPQAQPASPSQQPSSEGSQQNAQEQQQPAQARTVIIPPPVMSDAYSIGPNPFTENPSPSRIIVPRSSNQSNRGSAVRNLINQETQTPFGRSQQRSNFDIEEREQMMSQSLRMMMDSNDRQNQEENIERAIQF